MSAKVRKTHKCLYCDKSYARANNLSRHENDAHHAEVARRMKTAGLIVRLMYQAGREAHRDGAPAPGEYCVEGDAYRAGWYDADEDDAHDRALETGSATLRDAQP